MKNLIKSMIIALLFVYPALCTEDIGIINDDYYTHPDTIVSFRSLIPHDRGYMAVVDGTTTALTKTKSLVPFFKSIFVFHDETKLADEIIEATVLCGTRTLERSITLKRGVPYTFLRDVEEKTGELIVGGTQTVMLIKEFQRPGEGGIFRENIKSLYDLKMTREIIGVSDVAVCVKEWVITSQWQRKTRHKRTHYSAIDVYHVVTKFPYVLGVVNGTGSEEISRTFYRKELKFKCTEAESPECGNNGGLLPTGSVVVN